MKTGSVDIDLVTLKLHVADNGHVWYLCANDPARDSTTDIIGFLLSKQSQFPNMRLVGNKQNMPLILALYRQRLQQDSGHIEVCSPMVCRTEQERHDPQSVLLAMRQFERASSTGGWHILQNIDYSAYSLPSYMQKVEKVDDHARRLLKEHPVWTSLSFIPHLNLDVCIGLISEIVDPRWYVDINHVTRGSKLRSFLGLDIQTMDGVLGNKSKERHHKRCKLVLDAWNNDDSGKMLENPAYFLYRIVDYYSKKGMDKIGLLRASQKFLDFIRLSWLANLSAGRHQLESLFVPEYFFVNASEVKAFKQHIGRHM